jgi:hypothetical protein
MTCFYPVNGLIATEQRVSVFLSNSIPREFRDGIATIVIGLALNNGSRQFLAYTSKPYLQESKSLGVKVILFLLFMTVIFYFLYKEYWRDIH